MKKKSRTIMLMLAAMVILTIVFPLVGAERVYACSCATYPNLSNELDERAAVFAGEVTSIDTVGRSDGLVSSADPVFVTFEVSKVWKGSIEKETVVRTVRDSASCGYTFSLGGSYVVFADENDGVLGTGLCTATQPLKDSTVQHLDDIMRPYDPQDDRLSTDGRIYDHGRQVDQVGKHQSLRPVDVVHGVGGVAVDYEDDERDHSMPHGVVFLAFAIVTILSAVVGFRIGRDRK